MTNWENTCDIVTLVMDKSLQDLDESDLLQVGKDIAEKLKELPEHFKDDVSDIIEDLEYGNFDDLDWYLEELYAWGDRVKVFLGPNHEVKTC